MKKMNKLLYLVFIITLITLITGCVDQYQGNKKNISTTNDNRIIATSVAVSELTDILELDLVGIADSNIFKLPARYDDVKRVGLPMGPDMEIMKSLKPTLIISPTSLQSYLEEQYKDASLPYKFLDLSSVQGLYDSMNILATEFGKEEIYIKEKENHDKFIREYKEKIKTKKKPKVMILMGLPGSFVIATNKSYVGNLVELSGGENLFIDEFEEFLPVNTEELVKQNPDIILRTAHAMPEEVMAQFDEEFKTNDIWKHFNAVKNNKVYNLEYTHFGMSANMKYMESMEKLEKILYE